MTINFNTSAKKTLKLEHPKRHTTSEVKTIIKQQGAIFQSRRSKVDESKTCVGNYYSTVYGKKELGNAYYDKNGKLLYVQFPDKTGYRYEVKNADGSFTSYRDIDRDGNMDSVTHYDKDNEYCPVGAWDKDDNGTYDHFYSIV